MPGTTPHRPDAPERPRLRFPVRLRAPGWRRALLLRRALAGVLAAVALALALSPAAGAAGAAVLVAARDLPAGTTLGPADVTVRTWPDEIVPAGALNAPAQADGRILAGAARAGEPVTDLRLAGPSLAAIATGASDAVSVPIRLADPAVAGLLAAGSTVDVVTVGAAADDAVVLARGAVVLTVLPAETGSGGGSARGRLVLVALPRPDATRLAAAALSQQVAVTLR
jgi:Flp pilus assembly protein CpaB